MGISETLQKTMETIQNSGKSEQICNSVTKSKRSGIQGKLRKKVLIRDD
jgi:hypothetical protein